MIELLDRIESVSTEECRAAYDKFQNSSPGYMFDDLHKAAAIAPGTREILEVMWEDGAPMEHAKFFTNFIKTIEFAVREELDRPK